MWFLLKYSNTFQSNDLLFCYATVWFKNIIIMKRELQIFLAENELLIFPLNSVKTQMSGECMGK